jgi:hypothetical protein
VISLNLVLAGLRLGLKNHQVGEKWAVITVNASTPENTDKVIVLATHKGSASFTMRPLHRDLCINMNNDVVSPCLYKYNWHKSND